MLIGRLTQDGRAIAELVGGGLRGADRGERTWVARLAVPGAAYVIVPLCLGNQPTAAETAQRRPRRGDHAAATPRRRRRGDGAAIDARRRRDVATTAYRRG